MNMIIQKWIMVSAVLLLITIATFYFLNFSSGNLSANNSDWGDFGSYIGGAAGAIFTFLTIFLLIETLNSQNRNFHISQFESCFFELFRLHKDVTDRIIGQIPFQKDIYETDVNNYTYKGLKYFEKLSELIAKEYNNLSSGELEDAIKIEIDINSNYDKLYSKRAAELGHYFRSLYHLIKYVHTSGIIDKRKYVDLIQAHLSDAELHCTFYNGISKYGKSRLRPLLDTYSFFENIRPRDDIFNKQFRIFYPETFKNYERKPHP